MCIKVFFYVKYWQSSVINDYNYKTFGQWWMMIMSHCYCWWRKTEMHKEPTIFHNQCSYWNITTCSFLLPFSLANIFWLIHFFYHFRATTFNFSILFLLLYTTMKFKAWQFSGSRKIQTLAARNPRVMTLSSDDNDQHHHHHFLVYSFFIILEPQHLLFILFMSII